MLQPSWIFKADASILVPGAVLRLCLLRPSFSCQAPIWLEEPLNFSFWCHFLAVEKGRGLRCISYRGSQISESTPAPPPESSRSIPRQSADPMMTTFPQEFLATLLQVYALVPPNRRRIVFLGPGESRFDLIDQKSPSLFHYYIVAGNTLGATVSTLNPAWAHFSSRVSAFRPMVSPRSPIW